MVGGAGGARGAVVLLAGALLAVGVSGPTLAEGEETVAGEGYCSWATATLDIVVVPAPLPTLYQTSDQRQPIYVTDPSWYQGFVERTDVLPHGAQAPWENPHTTATVAALETWEAAMHRYADQQPGAQHLAEVSIQPTVLEPGTLDEIPSKADIVIAFAPTMGATAGATTVNYDTETGACIPAYDTTTDTQDCASDPATCRPGMIVVNSQWFLYSFTPTDTYNVMLHEVGHALGLQHVDHPADAMNATYDQPIGDPTNEQECPSNLNLEVLAGGFSWIAGEPFQAPPPAVELPVTEHRLLC